MDEYVILYGNEGERFQTYICGEVEKEYIVNDFSHNKQIVLLDNLTRSYVIEKPDALRVAKIEERIRHVD